MSVPKLDLLNLDLEEEMLAKVGVSLKRVRQRLITADLTFQLCPHADAHPSEFRMWREKVETLLDTKEPLDFPKILDFKRSYAKKRHDEQARRSEKNAAKNEARADRLRKGAEATERLKHLQEGKVYGATSSFGGKVVGEPLRTIENYSGLNTIYNNAPRTLVRRDGRFTIADAASSLPPWITAGSYPNSDPPTLYEPSEGIFHLPFKGAGRTAPPRSAKLREDRINRRNMLDSWIYRDPGPRYTHSPEHLEPEWAASRQAEIDFERSLASAGLADGVIHDPTVSVGRSTPRIILGEITRQGLLVEQEERVRSKSPSSSRKKLMSAGPSESQLQLERMQKFRHSFEFTSPELAAKMARADPDRHPEMARPKDWSSRDYTMGALSALRLPKDDSFEVPTDSINASASLAGGGSIASSVSLDALHNAPSISDLLRNVRVEESEKVRGDSASFVKSRSEASVKASTWKPAKGKPRSGPRAKPSRLVNSLKNSQGHTNPLSPSRSIALLPLTSPIGRQIKQVLATAPRPSSPASLASVQSSMLLLPGVSTRGLLIEDEERETGHLKFRPTVSAEEREEILKQYDYNAAEDRQQQQQQQQQQHQQRGQQHRGQLAEDDMSVSVTSNASMSVLTL